MAKEPEATCVSDDSRMIALSHEAWEELGDHLDGLPAPNVKVADLLRQPSILEIE